ncbi:MAG: ABC transporter permease [Firmicutes bacterium]|nr:ABC transporter permease [Bacillota bacterium]
MKLRTWKNIIEEGFKSIFRNRVMSLASISAITAALFVLGLVLAIILNFNSIIAGLESKIEISVFLEKETSLNEIQVMEQQISGWDGINSVDFISKEEALKTWREEWGDKSYLLNGYNADNNPLPDSFLIRVEKPEYVDDIVSKAENLTFAEKVQYSKDVVEIISSIAGTTRLIGLAIVIILIIMAMIIINNTIKITVFSRRKEINIMKYIGATDWYIRWPFLIEGLVLGMLGAIFGGGLTAGIYLLLLERTKGVGVQSSFLSMLKLLPLDSVIYPILILFFLVGSVVGVSASMLSIRRHLKV